MTEGRLGRIVVVIPTRNRADLAQLTVRSVLDQSGDTSLTVLISDNSTDEVQVSALQNALEVLRREQADTDLLLVRPHEPLPMGPHWEWARGRASAVPGVTHLLYLTDRTILKPGSLALLADVARRRPDQVVSFNNDQINDDQNPVRLTRARWSGQVVSISTHRLLKLSSELIVTRPLPRALNSLVPVSVFSEVKKAHGDVFDSTAPDFCFCFRFLDTASSMVYIDRPLTVMHGLTRSNGNSTTTGRSSSDTVDFIEAAAENGIARHAPLPEVMTTYNVIASEYQNAPKDRRPPLNRRAYVNRLARETDGFVPGLLRDANMSALAGSGVGFRGRDVRRRQILQALHYLRVLGPVDFAVLAWDQLRSSKSSTFATKEAALEAGRQDAPRRRSARHLGYLRGTRVGSASSSV